MQKALAAHLGKRILLEYKNVGEIDGKTSVLIGEKDKIVQAIVLYPITSFTKEAVTSKYGTDFVALNSDEPTCSAIESPSQKVSTKKNESSQLLVFPGIGMYALLNKAGKIDQIGFSLKCRS